MRMTIKRPAVALVALVTGCAHAEMLKPAAGVQQVPDEKDTAVAESAGVRLVLSGVWKGHPGDLWQIVTPVRVAIENHSGAPLRIHYKQFELTGPTGMTVHAIPPFRIQRPGVVTPYYPYVDFYVPPVFSPWYPGVPTWAGPFDYDPFYFDTYYVWKQPLPSSDMLAKALPVGVLDNGGRITGYLYFQKVPKEVPEVTFTANLVDAKTDKDIGKIAIPLVPAS
jgi:hypothetical protein